MGVFRITRPDLTENVSPQNESKSLQGDEVAPAASRTEYLDRLMKLIPGEVISGYTAARTYFIPEATQPSSPDAVWLHWILPIFFLAILIAIRAISTLPAGLRLQNVHWSKDVQWVNVGLAVGAFVIWLISLGDQIFGLTDINPKIGGVLIILFSVLVAFVAQVSDRQ